MTTVIELEPGRPLRLLGQWLGQDVDIAEDSAGRKWLRTTSDDPALQARLIRLPGRFYRLAGGNRLIRRGERVASLRLDSDLRWQRLDDVVSLRLPPAALAGRLDSDQRITLRLVRGGEPATPTAAIVSIEKLLAWVELASEVRLRRLRWVAGNGEALVMGDLVPPIEAQYFVVKDRILAPAGWHWLPSVSSEQVREAFGVRQDQWLVWRRQHHWSVIHDDSFVTLRRAAIRQMSVDQDGSET